MQCLLHRRPSRLQCSIHCSVVENGEDKRDRDTSIRWARCASAEPSSGAPNSYLQLVLNAMPAIVWLVACARHPW